MPSEYFMENFYWGTQPLGELRGSPDYTAKCIDMVGPNNVMYGSDIPHPYSDRPEDALAELEPYFDSETVRNIMGHTAEGVYNL
jgi:predicted TIM-barrel fold metal-dependent hydrolase